MRIHFQLLFIFKGIFMITIFQEKAKKKDTIWESKTAFINDFKDQNNIYAHTISILSPSAD